MSTQTLEEEKPTEVAVEPERTNTLNAANRCDHCGSQAYVSALLKTGILEFCGHCWNSYKAGIEPIAEVVLDERWKLTDTAKLDVSP